MDRLAHKLLFAVALVAAGTLGCADPLVAGPLVTGERGVTSIATDGFFVYWTTGTGAVKKVSVDGGEVKVLVPAPAQGLAADHLALDDADLVWTVGGTSVAAVKKDKTDKDEVRVLVEQAGGQVAGLSLDLSSVYWSVDSGDLGRAPRKGGAAETLLHEKSAPSAPVIHGSDLFWAIGTGELREMPAAGGTPDTVLTTVTPKRVAVNNDQLLWTTLEDSQAGTVNVAGLGGENPRAVASGQELVDEVAGDGSAVFWTSHNGSVNMVSLQGGDPQAIVQGPKGKVSLAVTLDSIYWANATDGEIWTMLKP